MPPEAFEVNFDGLVGPTHSYAGLSYGNIASMSNRADVSNPKEAALQGLTKAKALSDSGLTQGIFAPQARPDCGELRALGFTGTDEQVLSKAFRESPAILAACSSASSMWTANAATVAPSADSEDRKVHFTAANLNQKLHRSIEHPTTTRTLKAMFVHPNHFAHHQALVGSDAMGDEGAANHTRFCKSYGDKGLQLFVYGREALSSDSESRKPKVFPARQTLEASQAIARLHRLDPSMAIFAQQAPDSIDGGAFHNDVVSVGNQNVFFYHERAFASSDTMIAGLKKKFEATYNAEFFAIKVSEKEVPLGDAVKSYLFNSQLVTIKPGEMTLIAPRECEETPSVQRYLEGLLADGATPLKAVRHFDLRQSMRNGGGPACLRLRVVLTAQELANTNQNVLLNEKTFTALTEWVEKHYRDRLTPKDLSDPQLMRESQTALDELTRILNLGSVYPFQLQRS